MPDIVGQISAPCTNALHAVMPPPPLKNLLRHELTLAVTVDAELRLLCAGEPKCDVVRASASCSAALSRCSKATLPLCRLSLYLDPASLPFRGGSRLIIPMAILASASSGESLRPLRGEAVLMLSLRSPLENSDHSRPAQHRTSTPHSPTMIS